MDSAQVTLLMIGFLMGVGFTAEFNHIRHRNNKLEITANSESSKQLDEMEERWKSTAEYLEAYSLVMSSVLIVIGIAVGAGLFGRDGLLSAKDNGYFVNVYTGILSVLVTVLVIERFNRRREAERNERDHVNQLLTDARSTSNEIAKHAVYQLANKLKGKNGLLIGKDMRDADLTEANLREANLSRTIFMRAKLHHSQLQLATLLEADLRDADMQGAQLLESNLIGAKLHRANLTNAKLQFTDLSAAVLHFTNLCKANLQGAQLYSTSLLEANLEGAQLFSGDRDTKQYNAKFDFTTILPDGQTWTSNTDLERFINSNHPNFWRSSNPISPAYRAKDIKE